MYYQCADFESNCQYTAPKRTHAGALIPTEYCGTKGELIKCCNIDDQSVVLTEPDLYKTINDSNGNLIEIQRCTGNNCIGFYKPSVYELCKTSTPPSNKTLQGGEIQVWTFNDVVPDCKQEPCSQVKIKFQMNTKNYSYNNVEHYFIVDTYQTTQFLNDKITNKHINRNLIYEYDLSPTEINKYRVKANIKPIPDDELLMLNNTRIINGLPSLFLVNLKRHKLSKLFPNLSRSDLWLDNLVKIGLTVETFNENIYTYTHLSNYKDIILILIFVLISFLIIK